MKRLSIALAALGLSAGALAALPAATDPTIVSVPQLPGGFVIGGSGFYLQPSDTNGDLDYASVNSGTNTTFSSSLQNVQPDYDWGWGVNVGYIFPNTGNDVNLSYFELNTSDNSNSSIAVPNAFGANITPIGLNRDGLGTSITNVGSRAKYNLNQVDLTAGQFIDVGCRLILHPNVGLRWADLERKLTSVYNAPGVFVSSASASGVTTLDGAGNGGIGSFEKSDFSGIGPLVGIDASYYIGMGFGAVAHADSAVLVGNIHSNANATIVSNPLGPVVAPAAFPTATFFNSFSASNQQRVVPVVDMKLGADYTYVFNNAANSDLTLEAGWMFSNYFNAVDKLTVNAAGPLIATGGNTILARTTSDLGIQGPYVSLVFHA